MDVNALVGESLRIVKPDARDAGVHIEAFLAPGLPTVVGDGIQIQQVVLNPLRNAVEAMTGAGERRVPQVVTRRGRRGWRSRYATPAPACRPAERRDLRSVRLHQGRRPRHGTSISRTIVESHQGRLGDGESEEA